MLPAREMPLIQPQLRVSWRQRLQINLIAAIFFLGGMAAVAVLAMNVVGSLFQNRAAAETGALGWELLRSVGVLRPLLLLLAAFLLLRLGLGLWYRHVGAARWARLVLMWLMVVIVLAGAQQFITALGPTDEALRRAFGAAAPWLLGLVIAAAVYALLRVSFSLFRGDEDIVVQRTRRAWNLLAPTLIVFIVIGISPLERVFISSLTNERYASSDEVKYLGLQNYGELLGVRLDSLPCTTDARGACLTEIADDGSPQIVYPRARDVLGDDYRELRFREVSAFDAFGQHFIISARDREFYGAFVSTVIYTVFAIILQLVIGFLIALVLAAKLRGIGIMRVAMLIPLAIPTLIATQFWEVMLRPDQTGLINHALIGLGVINRPQAWLLESSLQLPAVIVVIVWKETPGMALLLLPGLLSISGEIYQAASVDGATRWQQFTRITLPLMRPVIGVALVLRTMVMLRVFDVFEILLGRNRFSMATYTHEVMLQRQQLGYASAISVTIFIIILVFTIIYMRSLRIDEA